MTLIKFWPNNKNQSSTEQLSYTLIESFCFFNFKIMKFGLRLWNIPDRKFIKV